MFGQILQKFAEKSPATVMVRALLEQLLNPEKLDQWFEVTRQTQYTRDILFSSLVGLMLQIVCKTQASVHAAYRHANIAASIIAVYGKLQGVELTTSQALVRYIAREAQVLIETMNGGRAPLLPGYRLKYLDGNCVWCQLSWPVSDNYLGRRAPLFFRGRVSYILVWEGHGGRRWGRCRGFADTRGGDNDPPAPAHPEGVSGRTSPLWPLETGAVVVAGAGVVVAGGVRPPTWPRASLRR